MKFKIGDKVRVVNKEDEFYDQVGEITEGMFHFLKVNFDSDYGLFDEDELIKEENMYNVGDILINKDGYKRKVLAVFSELTALSANDYFAGWYTKKELEEYGYKLANEEETTLSMQEVADKFGVDVDKLKIKKGE